METDEGLAGLRRSAGDMKVSLRVRIGAMEKVLRQIGDDLTVFDARLGSMENDLAIIKDCLVTKMRSADKDDEEEDEDVSDTHETGVLSRELRIDPQFVAKCLKLTPAESMVAVALAGGNKVVDIAALRGNKPSSVRWLLRQINRKLKISRQHQLVRAVLLLRHRNGARDGTRSTVKKSM